MGTRGLYGVVVNGEVKASYNHFDSYPTGLGMKIVEFVQGIENVADTFERAQALTMVDEYGTAPSGKDWYNELRDTQGDLSENLKRGVMIDSTAFGEDSLFCEWGYLVNLDDETVEVYRGFQTRPHTEGRWSDAPEERGYYGIKLIGTVPLDDLTKKHMERFEKKGD